MISVRHPAAPSRAEACGARALLRLLPIDWLLRCRARGREKIRIAPGGRAPVGPGGATLRG